MFLNHSFCSRAEKDAKKKGTILIKEFEKNKREIEKETKKMERELLKEKLQSVCVVFLYFCYIFFCRKLPYLMLIQSIFFFQKSYCQF